MRRLAATVIEILHTRLELLAVEVQEEELRLARIVWWGFIALFFLALAVLMLTLLIVVLFWDTHRMPVVALLAGAYGAVGLGLGLWVRAKLRAGSKLFSASLAELAKDRERLMSRDV